MLDCIFFFSWLKGGQPFPQADKCKGKLSTSKCIAYRAGLPNGQISLSASTPHPESSQGWIGKRSCPPSSPPPHFPFSCFSYMNFETINMWRDDNSVMIFSKLMFFFFFFLECAAVHKVDKQGKSTQRIDTIACQSLTVPMGKSFEIFLSFFLFSSLSLSFSFNSIHPKMKTKKT